MMKQYIIFVNLKYKEIGVGGLLDDMIRSSPEELKRLIASQSFTTSHAYNRYLNTFMLACQRTGCNPNPTKITFAIYQYNYYEKKANLDNCYGGYEFEFTPIGVM